MWETTYWQKKHSHVVGLDEVGRGALAGPIVVGAALFSPNHRQIEGVRDSKQLSRQQRTTLAEKIMAEAIWSIGMSQVEVINQLGIVPALHQAVEQTLNQLKWDVALIDGLPFKPFPDYLINKSEFIVKGDQQSYSIAAASILAKVYRDELMCQLSTEFPEYGWERNVGYGTRSHQQAITQTGLTPHHRTLFCRNILAGIS